MSSLRLCSCAEFDGIDPVYPVPRDRIERLHYVKHGPIQPSSGFVRGSDGRAFRAEYYVLFPWLEYSLSRQAAFCFYCRLFACSNETAAVGGKSAVSFISSGFSSWGKAVEKSRGFRQHDTCQ